MPRFKLMTSSSGANIENNGGNLAESWEKLRGNEDIQFSPVTIPEQPPKEPSWLQRLFEWLGDALSPLGEMFGSAWPFVKWVLLALLISAVLFMLFRLVEPYLLGRKHALTEDEEDGWQPEQHEARALLEDADRLANEGRFAEATHLLLQRSIDQIATARPEWVEPSSTARELAAISALPVSARDAFGLITERVERSLFALRALDQQDWNSARSAYAEFALARLDGASI
jgi:hypothetical protein